MVAGGLEPPPGPGAELVRLIEVTTTLRRECPWDAEQTHRSLMPYLVEETYEVIEAIEQPPDASTDAPDDDHLREELGDLLFQIYFHAELARERGAFGLDDVARDVADKLIARHPHVFAGETVTDDLNDLWERRKAAEKQRQSALDGIPEMSALTRAAKVIGRSRSHRVSVELPEDPIAADRLGSEILALVARAKATGLDAEQVTRDALRSLEREIVRAERVASDQG